jgi:hypothetical protein
MKSAGLLNLGCYCACRLQLGVGFCVRGWLGFFAEGLD